MKVKCIKLLDSGGRERPSSPWLTLGKIYHVLAIEVGEDGRRLFRILTRDKLGDWPQMGLHLAECFEVTTTKVPSSWNILIYKSSAISVAPASWQTVGFLEEFYNHEPWTLSVFKDERMKIEEEDP